MADNYVGISIKATDGAKPELDALKAKLEELSRTVAEARADVTTKEGEARLLALDAQLDAISKKVASPRIDMAGAARALAQVTAVDVEMDRLKAKADREEAEASVGGIIGRFLTGGKGNSGGGFAGGLLGKLPVIGQQLSGISKTLGEGSAEAGEGGGMAGELGSVASAGAGLVVVGGVVGALVTEVAALATGLSAAALGAGAFGALALPAFSAVTSAYSKIQTDQKAYDNALTQTAKNTALKKLKQDWAGLDPAERGALKGIQSLTGEFHKMSKAFEPTAFKVFNQGLGIANQLMPYLGKFANAAAPAIEGLLKSFSKGLDSSTFKQFMGFMQSLSGPVIKAVGSGMSGLGKDVMQLMQSFSKKDVLNSVHIAFRLMGAALTTLTAIIHGSMHAWDQITMGLHEAANAFDHTRRAAAVSGHAIASAFDATRRVTAAFAHGVAHDFGNVRHAAASMGHDVAHYFDDVRHAAAELAHGVAAHFDEMRHDAAAWVSDVVRDGGRVISFFGGLPGRIVSAVGNLGSLLFGAGQRVIQGLINGIKSMIGAVTGAIGSVVGEIASHLPFSPAKKGPLSGAGAPVNSGRSIARQIAQGLTAGKPGVQEAIAGVTGAVRAGTGRGGLGGAAGGGTLKVQLEMAGGGDPLVRALRQYIRLRGGSVQKVLGQTQGARA